MEKKKFITISGTNIFYKARREIGRISRDENVDIGVALDMFIHATRQTGHTAEKEEFLAYVAHLQKTTTEEDNRVAKFFEEG